MSWPTEISAPTLPLRRACARPRAGGCRKSKTVAGDKVERWAIDRLIPYAKNARTHSDAQIAALAASVKEWGWTTPVLFCDDAVRPQIVVQPDGAAGPIRWCHLTGGVGQDISVVVLSLARCEISVAALAVARLD
jgi:hypothetical protein